jgi:putative transposase
MKKTVTNEVIAHFGLSERRACVLTDINRASYRYTPEETVDDGLRDSIKRLAEQHPKYGYRMITLKLRQQNILANHKRIERVYREEGLQLAKRHKRRKTSKVIRNDPEPVTDFNEEWAMDFVSDSLHNGGRFRIFNLIDTYSRTALQMQARSSISGIAVTQFLDEALFKYGKPRRIRCDNGPEFAGKALDQWCYRNGINLFLSSRQRMDL